MRIGIDARFLTHPQPGGFKTYTENLITALADLDKKNEYVLYLDRTPSNQDKVPVQPNFERRIVSGALPFIGVPWREQIGLARQVAKDRLDLFHAPCLTAPLYLNCPLVVTVHDMIWSFPQQFSKNGSRSIKRKLMERYNYAIPKTAIKRASAIITVSHAAKESIVEHSGLKADHIFVTYEAASPSFKQIKAEQSIESVRQKYKLPPDFIFAIGSADPRKNINALVQAYVLLSQELKEKYPLLIVWTHSLLTDELSQKIEELGLTKYVRFLRQVSTDDLVLLYNVASLFVFPSLYEGFGLPLLEAMACGVPVIASNNSSIPEIVGEAALLFEAQDTQSLSSLIEQVLTDDILNARLQKAGLARSAEFAWEKCAQETLMVYKQVLAA
jgi:glycosyltransferase involved in cell wall biosynthesis